MIQSGLLFRTLLQLKVNREVILNTGTVSNFSELLELFSQQPPTLYAETKNCGHKSRISSIRAVIYI